MKVIVIGAGIVGLSISYELEKNGCRVLRIDDGEPQASLGSTRIFRTLHEDPLLEKEAMETASLWRDLEEELSLPLIVRSGLLLRGGWSHSAGYPEVLATHPLSSKSNIYAFDKEAGFAFIDRAMRGMSERLEGKRIVAQVIGVDQGCVVLQDGQRHFADLVVIACGFRTGQLLRRGPSQIMYHTRFLFPYRDKDRYRDRDRGQDHLHPLPVLIDKNHSLYALPEKGGFALGLTKDLQLDFIQAKKQTRSCQAACQKFRQQRKAESEDIVQKLFPSLVPRATSHLSCLREQKKDDGYELSRDERVLAVSGNNLFKFAPLLAKIALDEAGRY